MGDVEGRESDIRESWEHNAEAWTAAVRGGHIASRRAGTDAAILHACERAGRGRALDVGCGEGWLARALAARGMDVLGIDGSPALVEEARAARGGPRYEVVEYDALVADAGIAAGPWSLVVCNFALLAERIAPLLGALRARLAPGGALVIQTVHPWSVAAGEPPYADGWRTETFARMEGRWRATMPWHFRTLASWVAEVHAAGLTIVALEEPRADDGALPLSLILECRAAVLRDLRVSA